MSKQKKLNCGSLWLQGIMPANICCPACHVRKDIFPFALPDKRIAYVCCGAYAYLQSKYSAESYDGLKGQLTSNSSTAKNEALSAEDIWKGIEKLLPASEEPHTTPASEESEIAWISYYLQRLRASFKGNPAIAPYLLPDQSRIDRAVALFSAEKNLSVFEAARVLFCEFSEGLRTDYTKRFEEIYSLVIQETLDKYNV